MKTRLGTFFNGHIINEAGMMTRGQKKAFDQQYGQTARKVQERKKIFDAIAKMPLVPAKIKEMVTTLLVPNTQEVGEEVVQRLFDDWVSPSQMKFYFKDDPFMYVLYPTTRSLYNAPNNPNNQTPKALTFQQKLADDGLYFEKQVYEYYKRQYNYSVVKAREVDNEINGVTKQEMIIFESDTHDKMVMNEKKRNETRDAILKGVPIICQGVLWNEELKVFGIADMIVRSDYISKLVTDFKHSNNDEGLDVKAPLLNGNYHYRVIDIKSKTIEILKDGFTMSNNEKHRFYKAQLWCYNSEVSRIQGYDSKTAYILGKRTECLNTKTDVFNQTFGVVDFSKDVTVRDNVWACLKWIRDSKLFTFEQLMKSKIPLPRHELYPNMKRESDMRKTDFANTIKEISLLYYCGKAQRNKAFSENIFSYDNPSLNAKLLGFKEGNRQKCVDVDILLSRTNQPIYPPKEAKLKTSFFNEPRDYFAVIDFEFLTEPNFDELPKVSQSEIVFMIGFFMKNYKTGQTYEKTFVVNELTPESERQMMHDCFKFYRVNMNDNEPNTLNQNKSKGMVMHHWGNADQTQWNHLCEKYAFLTDLDITFCDMSEICKQEPIMVCGAHGFSLKSYVKQMIDRKIITSSAWSNTNCLNGNDAVCYMKKASDECKANNTSLPEHPLVSQVVTYNKADCKVVWELYEGLKLYYFQ